MITAHRVSGAFARLIVIQIEPKLGEVGELDRATPKAKLGIATSVLRVYRN